MKNTICALVIIGLTAVLLYGCSQEASEKSENTQNNNVQTATISLDINDIIDEREMFTDRDINFGYDDEQTYNITLRDNSSSTDSEDVTVKDNIITVEASGIYIVSGSLSNGQIIIDADTESKVQLVLDGVKINCDTSAPIYCKKASKLFITSINKNSLSNKKDFVAIDENNINSVIYSKCDLTLNGSGTLDIDANYGHAVSSKKDLKVTGGIYNISSAKHCLDANNSIRVKDGSFDLSSVKDAMHANNDKDEKKGYIYIEGGSFEINAEDDGIHSSSAIKINDASININSSNEGIEGRIIEINEGKINIISNDDGFNASYSSTTSEVSQTIEQSEQSQFDKKGSMDLSSRDCSLTINGGTISINAGGDGIDSNGIIVITGGNITVFGAENDGNSAIDYETSATISGGNLIALGMSGMAEGFSDSSAQCSITYCTDKNYNKGDVVALYDSNNNEIISVTAEKSFNCIVASSPKITEKGKYTLKIGDTEEEIKMNGIAYSNKTQNSKMGPRGLEAREKPENMNGPRPEKEFNDSNKN
ncbi:MAG: carbohydrate-binding domain-containing protein [Eubacterium sp.]